MKRNHIRQKGHVTSKTFLHPILASLLCAGLPAAAAASTGTQATFVRTETGRTSPSAKPLCKTIEEDPITITCEYAATLASRPEKQRQPRIVLNRFVVSFNAHDESVMSVELTFTNEDTKPILDARTVNLAIDDGANHNYLRRTLPQVDFRTLAPGKSLTYSDRLLAGSFPPGHYMFHLSIPNPDSSRKFNSNDNLLLSSEGVPNPATGLNTLAEFTVRR
jgi:hypothetical protein